MVAKKTKSRVVRFKLNQRYSTVLGIYIQHFAAAENQLFLFATQCAGLQIPMARAILSGPTVDGLIGLLRRIWVVYPPIPVIHEEMEWFLTHLSALQRVRNSIVHNMSFTTSDKGHISSNYVKALSEDREREHPLTWQVLVSMGDDLTKIIDHMQSLIEMPIASRSDRAKKWPTLDDAWRYTPPQDQSLKSPPRWLQEHTIAPARPAPRGSSKR